MVAYVFKFQNIRVLEQIFSGVDVVFAIDDTNNPFWSEKILLNSLLGAELQKMMPYRMLLKVSAKYNVSNAGLVSLCWIFERMPVYRESFL